MNTTQTTSNSIQRVLHLLFMAKMELDFMATDERLKPEARRKFARYADKFIGWVLRDIKTDNPTLKGQHVISQDLDSERAKDLALHIDFMLQFSNIGEISEAIQRELRIEESQLKAA